MLRIEDEKHQVCSSLICLIKIYIRLLLMFCFLFISFVGLENLLLGYK